ncbi:dynein regulatory complex subunit 6 isoform X1 [Hibiscus syriacus]|nr:dynein regulatory complex subunit 6 isoform X1 [Hibiscus syriacus]
MKGKSIAESEYIEKSERKDEIENVNRKRRFSREEKGKGKLVVETDLESEDESLVDVSFSDVELPAEEVKSPDEKLSKRSNRRTSGGRMERFRDAARRNASRFAYFNTREEEEENNNNLSVEAEREIPSVEEHIEEKVVEDWPGPFSTAMKIIRDRTANLNVRQGSSSSDQVPSVQIKWVPQKGKGKDGSKRLPPSLLDLSLRVLVDNADAIASLDHVPDAMRHKLCQMLCDSRQMNSNLLDLLLSGSPTEIRLRECSWLTEDQFSECFVKCDTSNLTVLQLDYCGQCLADYNIPSTLARSLNSLPALTTLSLTGAYRLSDAGLSVLVSSAPALRSVNLSQCSFLTHGAIEILASSLASVLLELFINDCQSIDAMLMLPSLKKLERLKVLSVAGLESVTDKFIKEIITARGDGMKELILSGCGKLTDSSLKIIAETCSSLRSLDIGNVPKLTDNSLGYLASGCRSLELLKLCRNTFSDDAIGAFLEISGEVLKELALNNVGKVGHNTALSLARRSRNLVSLDLSWCRNLTDEAMGLIVDSCLSLRVLKLFGCTQITDVFLYGHSNAKVEIIGLKLSPLLEHI